MKELDSVLKYLLSEMHSEEKESLLSLTYQAGAAIMPHYRSDDLAVQVKPDHSPVTAADLASQQVIVKSLLNFVDLPILSEEKVPAREKYSAWDSFWLVDPLDGTKEFIRGRKEFTINIALIIDTRAVFGILYAPAQKQIYYAARGLGAYSVKSKQSPQRLRVVPPRPEGHILTSSRLHSDARINRFISALKISELRALGSAIKFALVAEGSADIYPRFAPTCLWDTAAGQCLVEEAGGMTLDPNLQPLVYSPREGLKNPPFIVCARIDEDWSAIWQEIAATARLK